MVSIKVRNFATDFKNNIKIMEKKAFKSLLEFKKESNNIYNLRGRKITKEILEKVRLFEDRCQETIKAHIKAHGEIKDIAKKDYTFIDTKTNQIAGIVCKVFVDSEGDLAFPTLSKGSLIIFHWYDFGGSGKYLLIEDILEGGV